MSVAGIDVGDSGSCIALARKGGACQRGAAGARAAARSRGIWGATAPASPPTRAGVDVLLNKESKRETPSVVTFTPKHRQMGTDAGARARGGSERQRGGGA